jgi:nucleoside diphosphate kinase
LPLTAAVELWRGIEIVVMAPRDNAVKSLRDVMGATNPANAAEGTICKRSPRISSEIASMVRMPETAAAEPAFLQRVGTALTPATR